MPELAGQFDRYYGKGLESLFPEGSAGKAIIPFPRAGRHKDVKDYDEKVVHEALRAPPQLESIDPRTLHGSQPEVTRAGVAHYMQSGDYERSGKTFADQGQAGNQYPLIYSRGTARGITPKTNIILAGHHRATAALLKGEQLQAIHVEGGWGGPRR